MADAEDLKADALLPEESTQRIFMQGFAEIVTSTRFAVGSTNAASGSTLAVQCSTDPDLAVIVRHWHNLPTAVRAGIVAMVRASVEPTL